MYSEVFWLGCHGIDRVSSLLVNMTFCIKVLFNLFNVTQPELRALLYQHSIEIHALADIIGADM